MFSYPQSYNHIRIILLLMVIPSFVIISDGYAQSSDSQGGKKAGSPAVHKRRVYTTMRLTTPPPVIDGKLNDACWKTGNWAAHFTQFVPKEGGKPSQRTELKILYDNNDIYVAIRAYDNQPDKIQKIAGARDDIIGDMVGVNFDSYNDDQTGFEFDLTAYGQKVDLVLTNPGDWDVSWNPVWYGKVGYEDSAWVAEMKIPLSQLRYSSDSVQTWGLHCWRWINRLKEEDDWEVQSLTGPGIIYNFGHLRGIKDLKKSRRIEIMPYTSGRLNTFKKEPGNPFADRGRSWAGNIGLNAKLGLTSNFTLDMAVNPDFGQVEADPSVMNLTAFETFYEEKRPFFVEGKNLFNYNIDDINLFYSRRIGHTPSYHIMPGDSQYVKSPEQTTILSAVKVSGKTSKNLSVAVMQSLTAKESARISNLAGHVTRQPVEPLTNYTVARIQKNYHDGNTIIGGILTSTNRFIHNNNLDFLSHDAYTGGLDLTQQWNDKEFYLDAKLIGSYIKGSQRAITLLQEAPARYYQRPGTSYLNLDSTRTFLNGFGGKIKIGKGSKGLWRYSTSLSWYSPGLELNDLGYMKTVDAINQVNAISYFVNKPVSIFRTYRVSLEQFNDWDFNGDYLGSGFHFNFSPDFRNKWSLNTNLEYHSPSLDTRILRGGYATKIPSNLEFNGRLSTDDSRNLSFTISYDVFQGGHHSASSYEVAPGLNARITDNFRTGMTVRYANNHNRLQYVTTIDRTQGNRYILGTIRQQTVNLTLRVDYIITPLLSIRYYGSPFVSRGRYSDFKYAANTTAKNYDNRFTMYGNARLSNNRYQLDENGDNIPDYSIANPDFNFRQFRSNLVLKWRYRPGSAFYLVWSSDRTGYVNEFGRNLGHSFGKLWSIVPNNIFLVKLNYWFSL